MASQQAIKNVARCTLVALLLHVMDESLYKDAELCDGVVYHYFVSPPDGGMPTLLFCHGWPSTSFDWRFQVTYFVERGYGVIAPDMLGYGGTHAPTELREYTARKYCEQLVALLDLEGAEKVVAIGHDWGSVAVSNLSNWYPDRFVAFAFLGTPYIPPDSSTVGMPLEIMNARMQYLYGYEPLGFWMFLSSDEERPAEVLEAHLDSLYSLIFSADPTIWKTELCPAGALKRWLVADHVAMPMFFMHEEVIDDLIFDDEEDAEAPPPQIIEEHQRRFKKAGIAPSLNWFKSAACGLDKADFTQLPPENRFIKQPVFLAACTRDAANRAERVEESTSFMENPTLCTFDCGHWVQLEKADELNAALEEFVRAQL